MHLFKYTLLVAAVGLSSHFVKNRVEDKDHTPHAKGQKTEMAQVAKTPDHEPVRSKADTKMAGKAGTKLLMKAATAQTATAKQNGTADALISTAMKYIGRPYSFGSPGPTAFDCSGFTSYVYRQHNTELTHSSRSQYQQGTPVERQDLKKGDLVFFGNTRRGQKGISHVGIVTEVGENGHFKFVHASCTEGIKVDNSESGYYSNRYVGACRVLDNESE